MTLLKALADYILNNQVHEPEEEKEL